MGDPRHIVAVSGLFFNPDGKIRSMGINCALCHSTVDDSFAPGIGKRLDGWANRDLNVGAIVSLAPDLSAVASKPRYAAAGISGPRSGFAWLLDSSTIYPYYR